MISLIFDTETTGLVLHPKSKDEVQPRIIEWAGILVDENGEKFDDMVYLINPDCEISEEITNITGITNEMLIGRPKYNEVVDSIYKFCARADRVIAHNLPFDLSMMELEATRLGLKMPTFSNYLCTVQEHEPIYGFRPPLTKLYEDYTGKPLAQTHRALDDVEALATVCKLAGVLK